MSKYGPGLSFKEVCEMELEQIEHALRGELACGETESGFTYMKMPEKECKAFILDAYKECAHQGLVAMHGSRAIEKVYVDQCGGKPPRDYLQKYVAAMYATADPDNLNDVIGESGEEH